MCSVYYRQILLDKLVPYACLCPTNGDGVWGEGFKEKGPKDCRLDRMPGLIQAHPSSSVPMPVVRPRAASAFIAEEISPRNIQSPFPGSGPRSRLPIPQHINTPCYFLLEQIKSGAMTHSG